MKKHETLEVVIKDENYRALYKAKAATSNQKQINNIFLTLRNKFNIFFRKLKESKDEESGWWD